jgi:hypothetical protein
VLGNAVADADGGFSQLVTLPADLAAGKHNIVAIGVDSSGATLLSRMPVTYTAAESLPDTGVPAQQLAIWATASMLAGGLLLEFSRRRNANRPDTA